MNNKELLEREIERELEKLKNLEQGSKEHSEAAESICKLMKMSVELNKQELEREKFDEDVKLSDRHEANDEIYHERAEEMERKKLSDSRKKLIADIVLGIAGVGLNVAGICTYKHLFKKTLEFEETGSITSGAGKNLMSSMKTLFRKN